MKAPDFAGLRLFEVVFVRQPQANERFRSRVLTSLEAADNLLDELVNRNARRRAAHFLRQRNARRHLETVAYLIELPKLGFWLRLVSSTAQKVVDPSFRASLLRLPLDTRRALDGRWLATRVQGLEDG